MNNFNPRGNKPLALEQNIFKYRAIEMALILFHVEDLKGFALRTIQTTDEFLGKMRGEKERLPDGTNKIYQKLWKLLVDEGVISSKDKIDIEGLIDFRNNIAHSIETVLADINNDQWSIDYIKFKGLNYRTNAVERLLYYKKKIFEGLRNKSVFEISMNSTLFHPAEWTYSQELKRLEKKINRLINLRNDEITSVNKEVMGMEKDYLEKLSKLSPRNFKSNGQLSKSGTECCYSLFNLGISNLTISYLMRLSLKSVAKSHKEWQKINA